MLYNMEESGRRIARLRIQKGYTQERLSDALNIDRSFLSRVEAGKKGCSVDLFVQLSAFFGVSLDYLIVGRLTLQDKDFLKENIGELMEQLALFRENL